MNLIYLFFPLILEDYTTCHCYVFSNVMVMFLYITIFLYYVLYIIWVYIWRRKWKPISVFLPGESPWTEEPGRLQSMGSQELDTT